MKTRTNGFAERAMLVSLNITFWQSRKHDKKVSKEVAESHKTDESVGRYWKNLFPVGADSYKAVWNAMDAARNEHYKYTLPWLNDGSRILLASNFDKYVGAMRKARAEVEARHREFEANFPSMKAAARQVLKTMFREDDYPAVEEIKEKFSFATKVFPIPDKSDFRVELAAPEAETIRRQIESEVKEAAAEAMKDVYRRLHEVVAKMAARLNADKPRFRRSLVENVRELCDLLPGLNLTRDENLDRLTEEARARLTAYDAEVLRGNDKVRRQVADDARRLEKDLAAYMGGGA